MADYNSDYTGAQVETLLDKIDALPSPTSGDSGKILSVTSSGGWTLVTPSYVYSGSASPSSATGNNGDIYLQT